MFKSQIRQMYREYACEQVKAGKKQIQAREEVDNCSKALLKKIGDDEELRKLFNRYDATLNNLNYADIEDVFIGGYIMGARMALEICEIEYEDD